MYLFIMALFFNLGLHAQTSTVCAEGLEAFSKTLHPELTKSCAGCHGDTAEAPRHSQEDPKLAYQIAKPLANFNQLERSQFIQKVRAKHWLKYSARAKGMTEEKMNQLLLDWYDQGEKNCPTLEYSYVTNFVKIPDLSDNTFKKMRWKLRGGVTAEVEVQHYQTEGDGTVSFRFKKPRIASPSNLQVSGIHLVINEETNPFENSFVKINQIISGKAFTETEDILPFPVLAVEDLITLPRADATPTIGLAFNEYNEEVTEVACKNLTVFETSLQPEINVSCLSCHGDSTKDATKRFDMNLTNEKLCQEFTARNGVLYEVAMKGRLAHPTITNPQAANRFKRAFTLWNN